MAYAGCLRLVGYAEAKAALAARGPEWGLGFALGPDGSSSGSCWQGIDLDDIEANGLSDLANEWIRGKHADDGYVELSPSGRGMHIIGHGRPFQTLGNNGSGIEAYSSGRFFTVTEKPARLRQDA